ncbi:MAG: M23 family metallopeptidase, partial [Parcubacteria group bacterium]|nr:M23 family metallopeptidase [Parcubacteria group bacterium]
APIFVAAAGATMTLFAIHGRTPKHPYTRFEKLMLWVLAASVVSAAYKYWNGSLFVFPLLAVATAVLLLFALAYWGVRFGGGAVVLALGIWGMVMPEHWVALGTAWGSANRVSCEEVTVAIKGPRYKRDGELYVADKHAPLVMPGNVLRLARGSSRTAPTRDSKNNEWVEVLGIVDPRTRMVDPNAENFWYPVGYVRPYAAKDDPSPNAILHPETGAVLAGFNPADTLRNRESSVKLADPLGGRGSPVLGYGSRLQRFRIGNPERVHKGAVFLAEPGTPVHAAYHGVVAEAAYSADGGSTVSILHGLPDATRILTRYRALQSATVAFGDTVALGEVIGQSSARMRFEVATQDPGTTHFAYENPLLWIEGIPAVRIPLGEGASPPAPYAMVARPLPGSRDLYPFAVSQAVTVLDRLGEAGDQVEIAVQDPEAARYYVADGEQAEHPFRNVALTPTGWSYPEGWQRNYVFFLSPRAATYGELIAGVNGFSEPIGYGRSFGLAESGWICIGINEIVQHRRPDGSLFTMDDRSLNNYREGDDQFIVLKVTIRRNGAII